MANYVQPALPGFEKLIVSVFLDLSEMLEYLNTTSVDNLKDNTQILALMKAFGITSSQAVSVLEYWKALPKKEKKDE